MEDRVPVFDIEMIWLALIILVLMLLLDYKKRGP